MNDTINQVGAGAPALKVTTSAVTKLFIEGAENLDPITVFLEDFEPKRGKITVSCWGKSWTAYWGGMWDGMKVGEFFTQLNAQYIIGYFAPQLRGSKFSGEALAAKARREVLRLRRARDLDEGEARELYDDAEDLENAESVDYLWGGYSELMARLFGDEWWHAADDATEPNPDYDYLCRIIKAVQQALSSQPECGCCGRTDECDADCDVRQVAPAAPVERPVAWMKTDGSDVWSAEKKRMTAAHQGAVGAALAELYSIPLYTAPPASALAGKGGE